ncbi:IucA/IucC family C-terminal-domain containing protein [Paenibacillus thermotolerans]|uniref:IucA/IucC family C-terminal-domain containing protein n=1 Tax=Paenibacillus thermotolerans TaxID=3027807 RepID=UPI0023680E47|nr:MULTISPECIES: IucA/IucC family C-terminal-domain containing protein [unclassified Paenibacillus]
MPNNNQAAALQGSAESIPLAVDAAAFLTDEGARSILEVAERALNCGKPKVTASQFTKWYCRTHCISFLHSLSVEDMPVRAALEDIELLFPGDPPFAINEKGAAPLPSRASASRNEMRDAALHSLFAGNFSLVFNALIRLTGIRSDILWDNAAVYIHHFYRTWMEEASDDGRMRIIKEDYDYITQTAEAALFGDEYTVNPLFGSCAPFRNTCCLRVQIPGANKCKGCPLTERTGRIPT